MNREQIIEKLKQVLEFYSGSDYQVQVTKWAEEGGTLLIDSGELAREMLEYIDEL